MSEDPTVGSPAVTISAATMLNVSVKLTCIPRSIRGRTLYTSVRVSSLRVLAHRAERDIGYLDDPHTGSFFWSGNGSCWLVAIKDLSSTCRTDSLAMLLAAPARFERTTLAFKVRCTTNCARGQWPLGSV